MYILVNTDGYIVYIDKFGHYLFMSLFERGRNRIRHLRITMTTDTPHCGNKQVQRVSAWSIANNHEHLL